MKIKSLLVFLLLFSSVVLFSDSWDYDITLATEGYLHTNSDYLEWEYDFFKRKPLINIELDFFISDFVHAEIDLPIMKDRLVAERDKENYSNVITDISDLDMSIPNRALIFVGDDDLSISFGRDLLTIGEGLIVGSNTFYHDYLQASTNWKNFFYQYTLINLNETGFDETENRLNINKNFVSHEIGVKVFDIVKLSLIEGIMLQGMEPDLKLINPFTVLHNEYLSISDMANAFSSIHLVVTPLERIKLFVEFGVDQYATTYEEENWEQEEPNATGLIMGLYGSIPLGGLDVNLTGTYTYTDPYLGLDTSGISFTSTKNYVTHSQPNDDANGIPVTDFLGVGPDKEMFTFTAELTGINKVSLGFDYTFKHIGDVTATTDLVSYDEDAISSTTPSGSADIYNVFTLRGSYSFTDYLLLESEISVVNKDSKNDNQFILSLSYTL